MVQTANAALMERTPFAIDDAKDDEDNDSEFEDAEGGDDDQVLDEVRAIHSLLIMRELGFADDYFFL
jgi:TBC1 domain family member 8/9